MYNHFTTVPPFLGERLTLMMALPIAVLSLTLVVCAGNSSWHGKGVHLEVLKMSSWIWHRWNLLKWRGKEILLSFLTSFVSWLEVTIWFHSKIGYSWPLFREFWVQSLSERSRPPRLSELFPSLWWVPKWYCILGFKGRVWKNKHDGVWGGVGKCHRVRDPVTKLYCPSAASYK